MTKRSVIISIVIAAVLTVILEVLTMKMMNYNILGGIASSYFYFVNIMFIEGGIYFATKTKDKKYHLFSTLASTSVLVLQMAAYYFIGNLKGISIIEIFVVATIGIVFGLLTIVFFKFAKKHCKFTYYEE